MPAIKALVLTDGTTPVTLSPRAHVSGKTQYRASGAAVSLANPSAVFVYSDDSEATSRSEFRYTEPVTEVNADTGTTTVLDNIIIKVNIRVPGVCTPAQRVRALKRAFSANLAAALQTELETGEGQY